MDDIAAKVRVEVGGVSKYFEVTTNTLLRLILRFLLHINTFMLLIEISEDLVDELKKLERRLVIEFDHAQMLHEWGTVELIDDLLQF